MVITPLNCIKLGHLGVIFLHYESRILGCVQADFPAFQATGIYGYSFDFFGEIPTVGTHHEGNNALPNTPRNEKSRE